MAKFFLMIGFFSFLFAGTSQAFDKNKTLTILALGDSTTAGSPAFYSPAEFPPLGRGDEQSQYAYWIMKLHPEWEVLNRGVFGERADQALARFKQYADQLDPDIVVVLAGVNDLHQGFSAAHVEKNLKDIYDLAAAKNIGVMACTILPYSGSTDGVKARMAQVNDWILAESQKRGFLFCDTFRLLEDPQSPGALVSSNDGLHPDVAGYRKMGEALAEVIQKGRKPD